MITGTVMTLATVVAKTPMEASLESPPNLVVNMGVVDADGIAACNTMMARDKGVSESKRPVTNNAKIGIIINLHNTINDMAVL